MVRCEWSDLIETKRRRDSKRKSDSRNVILVIKLVFSNAPLGLNVLLIISVNIGQIGIGS